MPVDHAPDRRRGIVKELRSRLDDLSSKVSKQKPKLASSEVVEIRSDVWFGVAVSAEAAIGPVG